MDKYKRYYGIGIFIAVVALTIFIGYKIIQPKMQEFAKIESSIKKKKNELKDLNNKLQIVEAKIKKIKDSIVGSQKKIYAPIDSDLGNDTLFFTLYNDVIDMVHSNSVKIKAIDYSYNPEADEFVKFGKDVYFVCDINFDLVSNYVNLGNLIQDIYQYPYYIKINEIEIKPYEKNKTILLTKMKLRLYAHTAPEGEKNKSKED